MVSGFSTSPLDFSLISSGEARPIVILVKLLLILLSFLVKAILDSLIRSGSPPGEGDPNRIILKLKLIERNAQAEATEFVEEHIKRLGDAGSRHRVCLLYTSPSPRDS